MKKLFGGLAVASLVSVMPIAAAGAQPPDRVTICHATASETNPFVKITVSEASLPVAHEEHHDGGDIIPAPNNCGVPIT